MQLRPGSIGGMVQSAAIPPWAVGFVAMRSEISSRRSIRCPLGCSGLARGAGQTGSALARPAAWCSSVSGDEGLVGLLAAASRTWDLRRRRHASAHHRGYEQG